MVRAFHAVKSAPDRLFTPGQGGACWRGTGSNSKQKWLEYAALAAVSSSETSRRGCGRSMQRARLRQRAGDGSVGSASRSTEKADHCMDLDDATFEAVVNAHYEPLYRFAFSLAGHEAEARDLTQEAFAQLGRKAGQIQDRSKIKSWLFTTLYRAFVDSRRFKSRHPHVEVEGAEEELPMTPPQAGEGLDATLALQALKQVPEVYRAPLTLFYLEQHSYLEIADILGVPSGTVMSRISRGRALLRQLMEDKPRNILPLATLKPSVVS
jgi:RNA polymerase sigma-70 factor (ECF subfamily)